jgi:hypothetical protein
MTAQHPPITHSMIRTRTGREQPFFLSVAIVAVSLAEVGALADELSLAAINAKVIARRAGSQAAGFQPVTDFIDQTARATAKLTAAIGAGTLSASRSAVAERRAFEALRLLRRAAAGKGTGANSLDAVVDRCETARIAQSQSVTVAVGAVDGLLQEIAAHMRSISIITVQSRVEAQQAGPYRADLEAVAASMSDAAARVTDIVRQARRELRQALAQRGRRGIGRPSAMSRECWGGAENIPQPDFRLSGWSIR